MRRTNTFKLRPTRGQERRLFELADSCSRLWNEVTYRRRQTLFEGDMDWNTDEQYHRYKKQVGFATAQQIIRKSNEAWKSFFALLKQYDEGKHHLISRKYLHPDTGRTGIVVSGT